MNGWQRVLLGVWSMFLLAGFVVSSQLEPDLRGFGTHQQFGFPPCSFRMLFGVCCPSCGGTTCFAHFVRGELAAAFRANPAAFMLAGLCAAMVPWSWYSLWKGRLWGVDRPDTAVLQTLIVLCSAAVLQWTWRILM